MSINSYTDTLGSSAYENPDSRLPADPQTPAQPPQSRQANPVPQAASSTLASSASARRPIMAGNWKTNPATHKEAQILCKLLHANFVNHRSSVEVVVFPPFPFLSSCLDQLEGSGILVGAQNVGALESSTGAFTGEVSASMIRSMGCDYVLLGHSERRTLYKETDGMVNQKIHQCLAQDGLKCILCIGESLEEYESNLLNSVVDVQIKKGLAGVSTEDLVGRITIAYEPVWAIGTGKVATPGQAQRAHKVVRDSLAQVYGEEAASQVRIQYGGSVKADNVEAIMEMEDVDGALVGGASLTSDSFTRIVDGASSSTAQETLLPPLEFTAREVVNCQNTLGESPVWSERDEALFWVDAPKGEVWTWNLVDPAYRRIAGTALGCLVLQRSPRPGALVLAGESAILSMEMSASSSDFATGPTILCDRPERDAITRPNDGRVDRSGAFVFGMYNQYHRSPLGDCNNSGLYRLTGSLQAESIMPENLKFRVSNGICFSLDGKTIFFCDTPTRIVYAFDYGPEGLSNRRLVWSMPSDLDGGPDGAQVDADGYLWIALSGAGRVVRINPETGLVHLTVRLPVKSPTSCTIGGPDLDVLFITTRGPDGGGLFSLPLPFGIKGCAEPEFDIGML